MTVVANTAAATGTPNFASSSATGLNQLDNSQTFLNLLVAQLKNQNPDNPTDPTAFMTEIAQLTAVQSQTTLNADEETVAADSMLGRTVSGHATDGTSVNDTVTGVLIQSSGSPELELAGGKNIALSSVQAVYAASSNSAAAGSTTSKTA